MMIFATKNDVDECDIPTVVESDVVPLSPVFNITSSPSFNDESTSSPFISWFLSSTCFCSLISAVVSIEKNNEQKQK